MIFGWIRRRWEQRQEQERHKRQLAVQRRIATLKADVAAIEHRASECDKMAGLRDDFQFEIQAANLRGDVARLKVIIAHNLQNEDTL